jgi:uncharacterized cupin superfamily protein
MAAKILGLHEGKYLNVIGDQQWIKLCGNDTNGAYAMIEQQNPPGTNIPNHMTTREDETFYLFEGQVQFTVEGRDIACRAGNNRVFKKKTHPILLKSSGINRCGRLS